MRNKSIIIVILAVLAFLNIFAITFFEKQPIAQETKNFLREFTLVLSLIQENYYNEVDVEKLIYGAIRGMLRTLDPHTNFLDRESFANMKMSQRGSYFGLGIAIAIRNNRLTVIAPLPGSPASALGIQAGDIIDKIGQESTKGMDSNTALTKLRGPKETQVEITIIREGYSQPLVFTIERAEITLSSVGQAFFIEPSTGYIQLINFSETTGQELEKALNSLESQAMQRLLLDLRGNTGGLLQEAVAVTDKFISKGLIVYTKGRMQNAAQQFFATKEGTHPLYPLIILTDLGTASGAEIVAGAIQDHDRGLIVGQTSWGKGLVQSVLSLSYQTGLAMTTARYYTPSGRLIQRDYSHSFVDYFKGKSAAEEKGRRIFKTDLGRVVYGGGGITPDVIVESEMPSEFARRLMSKNIFFNFATTFLSKNRSGIDKDFAVDDEVIRQFEDYLQEQKIAFQSSDVSRDIDFIKMQIKAQIFSHLWGMDEGFKIVIAKDKQVIKALTLWDEAEGLIRKARQSKRSENAEF
jgi:carboxyl-terminal processing protease